MVIEEYCFFSKSLQQANVRDAKMLCPMCGIFVCLTHISKKRTNSVVKISQSSLLAYCMLEVVPVIVELDRIVGHCC